jgi:shikimate dehydrogenase
MPEKLLGLIGDPIEHSLSPALFEYVLARLELPYRYQAFRVRASELRDFLRRAREEGIAGFNVTIPHKERVMTLLDALDSQAQKIGAVNTVVNERGRLLGYNTDVLGFIRSLQARKVALAGERVVILGAGGAARAVIYALMELGVREIVLANRTLPRAEQLAVQVAAKTGYEHIRCVALDDLHALEAIRQAKLLVNATPVGLHPRFEGCPLSDLSCLHQGLIVYDLVYNPWRTRLLEEAQTHGAQAISGLDMLIRQALESLHIWVKEERTLSEELIQQIRSRLAERLRA